MNLEKKLPAEAGGEEVGLERRVYGLTPKANLFVNTVQAGVSAMAGALPFFAGAIAKGSSLLYENNGIYGFELRIFTGAYAARMLALAALGGPGAVLFAGMLDAAGYCYNDAEPGFEQVELEDTPLLGQKE